tara:strand:+ start:405 stop:611 length:207 start_codon:yes stop_codon:yes gene_type:complete
MYQLEFAEKGRPYRIFSEKLLGIWKYYIVEDISESTKSQGVDYNVRLVKYYFSTLDQIKVEMFDKFVK